MPDETPKTAMIVDDEPDIRLLLHVALESHGYAVVAEAVDGLDALEQLQTHDPDVMIVDLAMPNLGGVDLMQRLRPSTRTPMVGYTAMASAEDQERLAELGIPLVHKMQGIDTLVRVLDSITAPSS